MMIDQQKLEDLLDRVELPELVSRLAKTSKPKKSGKGYHCTCPLHADSDNEAAFSIFQEKAGGRWYWHCHTRCATGGDALTFIRKLRNCDFIDAVKELCQFGHVPFEELGLTDGAIAEHKERERRRDVLELASQFYYQQLGPHPEASAYLHGRAFTDEAIALAGFGYSDGKGLGAWLKNKNSDLELARTLGLLRKDGRDFTANAEGGSVSPEGWLIYVHRAGGRVEYLSARALNPDPDLKDKSRNLPGDKQIYRADVRGDEGLVIVEGQADAESWRQWGYSAWALCGTTFSDADLKAIKSRKKVFLGLDSDEAGRERTEEVAKAVGPLVMILPAYPKSHKDANKWLQACPKPPEVRELIRGAKPYIDQFIRDSFNVQPFELEERIDQIAALIGLVPETMQGRYIKKAAAALEIPPADIKRRTKQSGPMDVFSSAEVRNGRLYFRGDALGDFAPEIKSQFIINDGFTAPKIRYAVIGSQALTGKRLPDLELDAEEFESPSKWVAAHWGVDAIIYTPPSGAHIIARAMKELARNNGMTRETIHTFSGWTTLEGKRAFLSGSGAITEAGLDSNVRVELGQNRLTYYKLPAPPTDAADLRSAVQASLGFLELAPLSITVPLWAAMYGAPLMDVASLNAVIWVYGPTQSRKSTISMLALTHFGPQFIKSREYFAPRDWVSTITDIEGAMFVTKNLPLIIDDFAPQFTDLNSSRDMHKKAHQVVRTVGNRAGRGRANADLTERVQRPPRSLVVATAELPLIGQSIVGRMIYVPVQRGDVALSDGSSGPLDLAQAAAGPGSGLYSLAMSAYIQWLCKDHEAKMERAKANYEKSNQFARSKFPSTQSRLMDYYATLATYTRVGLEFAVSVGAISQAKALRLGNEDIPAALVDLLTKQSERVAGQSPVVKLFEAAAEMILSRKAHLSPRIGSAPTPPHDSKLIGWYGQDVKADRPVIYLRLGETLAQARDYWQRLGEGFDTTTDALQREIHQAGLLARRSEEGYTVAEWVASESRTVRVLAIAADLLPALTGVSMYPAGEGEEPESEILA